MLFIHFFVHTFVGLKSRVRGTTKQIWTATNQSKLIKNQNPWLGLFFILVLWLVYSLLSCLFPFVPVCLFDSWLVSWLPIVPLVLQLKMIELARLRMVSKVGYYKRMTTSFAIVARTKLYYKVFIPLSTNPTKKINVFLVHSRGELKSRRVQRVFFLPKFPFLVLQKLHRQWLPSHSNVLVPYNFNTVPKIIIMFQASSKEVANTGLK